jgi:serine kinase of HPr protein (carbohydrate metabolism regulator)
MNKKLTLEEIIQGNPARLGIKEFISSFGLKKEISVLHIKQCNRRSYFRPRNPLPHIAIVNPQVSNQLNSGEKRESLQIQENIFKHNVAFLFCSSSSFVPESLKNSATHYNIPVAASEFDEYYLASRLTGLLREKIQKIISLHGVVFESRGRGILLIGPSGIGKTTAAIQNLQEGDYWVADDVALVKKNHWGELIAYAHNRIKNLIHTQKTGITEACNFLDFTKIKKNTKLSAIIEIEKVREVKSFIVKKNRGILETVLPCLQVSIPQDGYFDKNLLQISLRHLLKDN